jgi:AAA+ superfamily predicted ATPase
MLHVTSAEKISVKLGSGEWMRYIPLPQEPYDKLRADFARAPHLAAIDGLSLKGAGGVMIRCHNMQDGVMGALYAFKKFLEDNGRQEGDFGDDDREFPMWDDEDEEDTDWDEMDLGDQIRSVLYEGGSLVRVPVILANALQLGAWDQDRSFGFGQTFVGAESESRRREPFWIKGHFPVIIEGNSIIETVPVNGLEFLERSKRFYVYVSLVPDQASDFIKSSIEAVEKTALFELNMEYCVLDKPEIGYYEQLMKDIAKKNGFALSRTLDRRKLVKGLMDYRGPHFRSNLDIEMLVRKAIRKKGAIAGTLNRTDFARVFVALSPNSDKKEAGKPARAADELDRLIGQEDVKRQLKRVVARLKFDKLRRNAGLETAPTHAAAVFMGSPGTAKTTVARILGRMLREEGVLASDVFLEVARKDLIGRYLGHTAPLVASVFEKAKGGTIFIDEAYSLLNKDGRDIFADEAMSEIIRQMENNPDTLVIFAGYEEEMRAFILNANPGLRSRLTNIVRFGDYSEEEMVRIFAWFAEREEYRIEDFAAAERMIRDMLNRLKRMGASHLGNGRLMRKLFNTAVGHMAEREDNDLRTILTCDIEKAAADILASEQFVTDRKAHGERIGFVR